MSWIDVLTGVGILMLWVGPCVGCYLVRRAYHRRQHAAELRAPLLPNSTEHRLDAALREADEGFNACRLCGFENFKRFPFCNVCGEKIPEHESEQQQLKKKKPSWGSKRNSKKRDHEPVSTEKSTALSVEPTQRQQRARKRKEWTRRIGADGALFWYRDGSTGADLR
ncbi:hypothetical protein Gpo141_00014427, partial [Globisporangium polare]